MPWPAAVVLLGVDCLLRYNARLCFPFEYKPMTTDSFHTNQRLSRGLLNKPAWCRLNVAWAFFLVYLILSVITRAVLTVLSWSSLDASWLDVPVIFLRGLLFDLGFYSYFLIPFVLYLWLLPERLWRSRLNKIIVHGVYLLSVYGFLFVAVAEYFFWDEFTVRFNFISVDYLVYTHEVTRIRQRTGPVLLLLLLPVVSFFALNQQWREYSKNTFQNELASNGPYQFFAAFRNNVLDYIGRPIDNPGEEQRHNVILVTIESFNADFLKRFADQRGYPDTVKPDLIRQYGGEAGMTPFLDSLIDQSLFFSRMYATGTRTVRGLEAITLSIPPTPGRSIVKRLGHESGMHSLGQVFRDKGYDVQFIYGGIAFENAWGMSDGDLYDITLAQADRAFAEGKPFFYQLMTTSNHRPFTFPEGTIDWPQHNRESVIAYTSYAIGEFLRQASEKPWFDDTVFVFIADHTSRAAGKASLQVKRYHIPMWIYAPKLIKPRVVDTLVSQIDVAPTLLALLNMDYHSWFFGLNASDISPAEERALIGNYQKLGLYKGGVLTYLAPVKQVLQRQEATGQVVKGDKLVDDTVAYYQGADRVYRCGLNKLKPPADAEKCLKGEIRKAR